MGASTTVNEFLSLNKIVVSTRLDQYVQKERDNWDWHVEQAQKKGFEKPFWSSAQEFIDKNGNKRLEWLSHGQKKYLGVIGKALGVLKGTEHEEDIETLDARKLVKKRKPKFTWTKS